MASRTNIVKTGTEEELGQRDRIIAAAVELFALNGVDGAGVRDITARAGVNVGAVNYHFGNKEALAESVFMELAARVNSRRLKNLEAQQEAAAAARRELTTLEVLELFIEPYLGPGPEADEGKLLAQFLLKHRLSPTPITQRIIRKHFDPMAKAFIAAIGRSAPHVDALEFYWRYLFMVSAVVLTITDRSSGNRLGRLSGGLANTDHQVELRAALLRFLVGGMNAL